MKSFNTSLNNRYVIEVSMSSISLDLTSFVKLQFAMLLNWFAFFIQNRATTNDYIHHCSAD